jgi:hypothetical protein
MDFRLREDKVEEVKLKEDSFWVRLLLPLLEVELEVDGDFREEEEDDDDDTVFLLFVVFDLSFLVFVAFVAAFVGGMAGILTTAVQQQLSNLGF